MGLDDPYPLGEMESDKQSSYPGKILDLAVKRNIIDQKEYDDIWEHNIIQWLCGDNENAKKKLIQRIIN
jgi:aminocarboxymuconate-semialdehyde decarboxylase